MSARCGPSARARPAGCADGAGVVAAGPSSRDRHRPSTRRPRRCRTSRDHRRRAPRRSRHRNGSPCSILNPASPRSVPTLSSTGSTARRVDCPRRWFIRRSRRRHPDRRDLGHRIGGDGVGHDVRRRAIGRDRRRRCPDRRTPASAQVAWLTEGGVRVVAGVGDVDVDETIAVAGSAVASRASSPRSPCPQASRRSPSPPTRDPSATRTRSSRSGSQPFAQGEVVDAAAAAFMARAGTARSHRCQVGRTPGSRRRSAVIPRPSSPSTPTAVATVVGLPGTDVGPQSSRALAVVPARDVTIGNPEVTHGIPADAKKTYGEIERGRWVVYEYSTLHGTECLSIDASWGGSGGCSPPGRTRLPRRRPDREVRAHHRASRCSCRTTSTTSHVTLDGVACRDHDRARSGLHVRLRSGTLSRRHHRGDDRRTASPADETGTP